MSLEHLFPENVNSFDRFVATQPRLARRILTAATLVTIVVPAMSALATIGRLSVLGVIAAFASILVYATGYLAAVWHRRHLRAHLAEARRDAVTGLPVRAVAEAALHAATAAGTRLTVALADVDGLRAVNNGLGHAAGDQYLTVLAERLARAVPAGGLLARIGGDEFVILAPDTDPADLSAALGAALAGSAVIAGNRMQPRASIGIAARGGDDAHRALARADAAMYSAKEAGGNHTRIFDPDRDGEPEPDGSRPLVRRRDLRPTCAEAVRWHKPRAGEDLLPVLWSTIDAATIRHALVLARDRFAEAATEAAAGAQRSPQPPAEAQVGVIDVEPTPGGYRSMAALLGAEQAKYARLVDRLTGLLDAARHDPDER
jgi:diguanylate cyclase (GGDEF)-like protein